MVNKKACVFFMGFLLLQGGYGLVHIEEAQAQQAVPFSQREQVPQRQQGEVEKQLNDMVDNVKLSSEELDKTASTMKPVTKFFNKTISYITMFLIAWTVIQSLLDIMYIQTKPIRPLFEKYNIPTKGAKLMIVPTNNQQETSNGVQNDASATLQGTTQQSNEPTKMSTSKAMLKYMQIRARDLIIMAVIIGVLVGTMLISKVSSVLSLI